MLLSDFDFDLPPGLIAQTPLEDRTSSRLLWLHPNGELEHRRFSDIVDLLQPGDLVVANNSRVFPARLHAETETGARVELLLVERLADQSFWALARPAKKLRLHSKLTFGGFRFQGSSIPIVGTVEEIGAEGRRRLHVDLGRRRDEYSGSPSEDAFEAWLDESGTTPLPPYIKSGDELPADEFERFTRERYQTVYASKRGSIACPTAGLHFTEPLIQTLRARGIEWKELSLHVGYATFQPIREESLERHRMGSESFVIDEDLIVAIDAARERGARIVAVGTTTVRALESFATRRIEGVPRESYEGSTNLFIRPGFRFRLVDALLTNFHLPRSSLLVLVSALGGQSRVLEAYREAVRRKYRFYSYGDAMLLYPAGRGASAVENGP